MSEVFIELMFENGPMVRAQIDRVLAPGIVEDIKARAPIEGRAAILRGEMKITIGLKRGIQKKTKEVKRGQIAYMPLGDSLCIYLKDMTTYSPVNVIGHVLGEEALERLNDVPRGAKCVITLVE